MRDPARADRLAPAYDSGDHLHPSEAGYRAMGAAVSLALFDDARPARAVRMRAHRIGRVAAGRRFNAATPLRRSAAPSPIRSLILATPIDR